MLLSYRNYLGNDFFFLQKTIIQYLSNILTFLDIKMKYLKRSACTTNFILNLCNERYRN